MIKLQFFIAFGVLLVASNTYSQDTRPVEGFRCTNISNDIARLKCYDETYSDHIKSATAPGRWVVKTTRDPLDDTTITLLGLNAAGGTEPLVGFGEHQLVIKCDGGELSAWVNWRGIIGEMSLRVTSRIGNQTAQTADWIESKRGTATFYPGDAQEFVRALMNANRFVAQIPISTRNSDNTTAIFDIQGLEAASEPIKEACLSNAGPSKSEFTPAQERLIEEISEILKEQNGQ